MRLLGLHVWNRKQASRICMVIMAIVLLLSLCSPTVWADHGGPHDEEEPAAESPMAPEHSPGEAEGTSTAVTDPPAANEEDEQNASGEEEPGAPTQAASEGASGAGLKTENDLSPHARSAILMDADSGTVIFEKNPHEQLPPASITKIMTMLIVMEELSKGTLNLDEQVTASEYAASMGGSQIFLEPGESMSVEDLLKGVAMASGNDATVALAEKIAGSEEIFIRMMNEKAKELGLKNTHFSNTNGLPAEDHYTSAYDIAVMSRELLKHEEVTHFTSKYQDYLRKDTEKPFWLVNTNKLVRFYDGADGLKTGYTSEAKFCLSATAKRGSFRIIAVVLGEPNAKTRNAEVTSMFNFAFSQYTNVPIIKDGEQFGIVKVEKGKQSEIVLKAERPYSVLMKKGHATNLNIRHELVLEEHLKAPVKKGQEIGKLHVYNNDQSLGEYALYAPDDIDKAGWWTLLKRTMAKLAFID